MSHLGGDLNTLQIQQPVRIVNTTIVDNAQFTDGDAVVFLYFSGAAVWLQGVTIARNNAPQVMLSYSTSDVYSDRPLSYFSRLDGGYTAALASPGAGSDFLSLQDPFFLSATAVRAPSPSPLLHAGTAASGRHWKWCCCRPPPNSALACYTHWAGDRHRPCIVLVCSRRASAASG